MRLCLVGLGLILVPMVRSACPTDSTCDNQRCYKFVDDQSLFYTAQSHCESLGGNLVSISNGFEAALVQETANSMFSGGTDYWIGAECNTSTGSWSWTDGTPWSYTKWFPGEPENSRKVAAASIGQGFWSTALEASRKPFVCALPLPPTNPTMGPTICPTCPTQTACPTTAAPIVCPPEKPLCPDGWIYFRETQSCYKVIRNVTWDDGDQECRNIGGHLTSIHDSSENLFVAELTGTGMELDTKYMTWIGLYRSSNGWSWTDGSEVDYLPWAASEPNNAPDGENCVLLWSDYSSSWFMDKPYYQRWNDNVCSISMRRAVCKRPRY